ncbi:RNA polymerase sigma factor [Humisphaera borealis]|uniref:Sigma-70 family RNA polymerase sigma factor n=1 Tax=Humisphaera borealis TaxID=2807512 RepID=A0A7M2WXM7_9BACT|nr:sigma-70 family RNA polymerase sigma factor [Humisphaera borealis]QOV90278.1 sigma-70 family RNA polymerase sigma factor [Humisphaera borealis]
MSAAIEAIFIQTRDASAEARSAIQEHGRLEEPIDKLSAAIADGDGRAIEAFYRRYFDRLYGWARRFTRRDEAFCLDVVQESVLRIVRTIRCVEAEPQLLAWLRLVVQTTAYDLLKASRRRERRESEVHPTAREPHGPSADESAMEQEQTEWLRRQIDALDPGLSRMIDLRYARGWTLARIGQAFGLTPGTVDGRLRRVLGQLRSSAEEAF